MNKICHKHFVHPVFFIISSVLLLVWFKTTTAASVGHQEAIDYKCIDKEKNALLHFKSYIHHDPEGRLSAWTREDKATNDCCKWSGVMCDETGHVASLYLGYGHLEGEISPSLLNLSNLNNLDLSYNSFNGTIPMFIGSMTQLMILDLSSNGFTGAVPPELGNLSNLVELRLRSLHNCTTENLHWLSHLSQLEVLIMDGISLAKADNWVNVILSLQQLSHLSLGGCDLSQVMHPFSYPLVNSSSSSIVTLSLIKNNLNSSMYHWLFPLTSNRLVDLDLSGNKLDGIPEYLGNLCSLTFLYFYNNSIVVTLPDILNNLSGCTSVTLEWLDASDNLITGSLSHDIQKFSSLQVLFLSNNQLNGTISDNVWQLPMLKTLDVSSNSLKGVISENIGKTKILAVDLSNNSLEGVLPEAHMPNLSDVQEIDLSLCKLGPRFPKWIQALKNLTLLNIANTGISDTIPVEFWSSWPSQLTDLNLSSNNFGGLIPNVSSTLQRLDLSENKFYGGISFLCQIVDRSLSFLDLSNNLFTGQIPDCLWHFKELKVLNLGQNKLSGRLSPPVNYLINLEVFYLYKNNFSGELPSSLKYCTKITFLDLGANKFSGHMPLWIGEKLSELYALSLASNNFFGIIPLQLCQLVNLQILDLSMNNLYGTIPSCLNNLTAMVQDRFSRHHNEHYYDWGFFLIRKSEYVDHAMIKWQGSVREFSSTLGLVKSIDLSSNKLTGKIPYELADLHELITRNLSMNSLLGGIPSKIGHMKELQILDLSRNRFSGIIPSSMSEMTLLNYLDVSYNNLSGRIPSSTQLQFFEPLRYTGNLGLCGPPLTEYCPGDKESNVSPHVDQSESGGDGIDDLKRWFYIGGATGFAMGFWMACGALLVNRRGRNVFFHFLDRLKYQVCVKESMSAGQFPGMMKWNMNVSDGELK